MPTEQIETRAHQVIETNAGDERLLSGDEISLLALLTIIARRKQLILCATTAVTLVALIVSLFLPNRYTATTTLLPPQQPQSLASAVAAQLGGVAMLGAVAGKDLGLKNPNDIYVGMLQSRVVADSLIQKFELMTVYRDKRMSDARKDLQSATDVHAGKEGFITVSVADKDPKRAAAVANAYVDELRDLTSTLAVTEAAQRRLFFEQQLQKAKADLSTAEAALRDTQQRTGLIHLEGQAKAIIESVAALRAQIAAKEVQLQAMQLFATDQNSDVVMLRQELVGLRAQLAKLERDQNSGAGDIQVPTGEVPQVGLEYLRRLRDVKYHETIFELLAKQFEAAKLDEARQGAVVQVVDPAVEPDRKSSPKRSLIVLVAFMLGLAGSVSWVLLAEEVRHAAQDPLQSARLQMLGQLIRSWGPRRAKL